MKDFHTKSNCSICCGTTLYVGWVWSRIVSFELLAVSSSVRREDIWFEKREGDTTIKALVLFVTYFVARLHVHACVTHYLASQLLKVVCGDRRGL